MAPFGGSPAYKAGIRPGDVILEVNDKKTDGLTTTEVADLLKGAARHARADRWSPAKASTSRSRSTSFATRFPRFSVPEASGSSPASPTSKSSSSTKTPARKWKTSSKKLGEGNIKGLVLDLRGNPGGLLNEGVEVAGHFLKKSEARRDRSAGADQPKKTLLRSADGNGGGIIRSSCW